MNVSNLILKQVNVFLITDYPFEYFLIPGAQLPMDIEVSVHAVFFVAQKPH